MTFPNDFWQHPKVAPLSDAAFRAFVELNGYSRMQDLDGRVPAGVARRMWAPKVLDELCSNHPERPSLVVDGDVFVIWNYAEHQQTRADRDALVEKNRANGRKGGRPPKNPNETQSVSSGFEMGTQKEPNEKQSQSQSPEVTDVNESSPVPAARETTDELPPAVQALASQAGLTSVAAIVAQIEKHTARRVSGERAVTVARWLLDKAKNPRVPQRYVFGAISRSPFEVQQFIDEKGLAA
ncbi:hypothetical protein [Agromyces sp. SYSU T00194]|uniref:hypothetical protein n=1 Tax=Agromyces chitinivorans TaxID=3158560 RepID=UPI0033956C2B